MATGFEANKHTRRDIVGQHPVPNRRRAGFVCSLGENPFGGLKAVCLRDADGKPNDIQEEVKHNDGRRQPENSAIRLGVQVIHSDGKKQEDFGDNPLDSPEFDVCDIGREVYAKDGDL